MSSCTTILVGKKASYDGSAMIARTEDSQNGSFCPKAGPSSADDKEWALPEGEGRRTRRGCSAEAPFPSPARHGSPPDRAAAPGPPCTCPDRTGA